jgi:hypothetical protein
MLLEMIFPISDPNERDNEGSSDNASKNTIGSGHTTYFNILLKVVLLNNIFIVRMMEGRPMEGRV